MKINYDPCVDRVAGVMRCAAWSGGDASLSLPVRSGIPSHLCQKVRPRIMPLMTADGEEDRQGCIRRRTGGQNGNKLIMMFCWFGFLKGIYCRPTVERQLELGVWW